MHLLNSTGLAVAWLPGNLRPPGFTLTLIVKGTFSLAHGAPVSLAPEDERFFLDGDHSHDDNPAAGPRYDSDFAPFKPRADILVVGSCHTPNGKPLPAYHAGIEVGTLRKRIAVLGDRHWIGEGPTARSSDPIPFKSMPLRYDRSFGGPHFDKNPIGRGQGHALPNIEQATKLISSPGQTPDPAGFGPLDKRSAH